MASCQLKLIKLCQLHVNIETNNTKEEIEKKKADSITLLSVNLI